jgi:outer membrane protein assembly factor BamB
MRAAPLVALGAVAAMALGLAGCGDSNIFFDPEAPPLPGERIPVLSLDNTIEPDKRIADLDVRLPRPYFNPDWPQSGGFPDRAMHHLAARPSLQPIWRANVGQGAGDDGRILATPIVADGRIFAMDAETKISAFVAATGEPLWRLDPTPEEDDEGGFGGGVAYNEGRLFAATGYGDVLALEPDSGEVIWRRVIGIPMRAPPVVADGRIFVITYDNQLFVLDSGDGGLIWSHSGIVETAGLLGSASPAVEGDIVIAPYSSGELIALRVENGRTVWSDTLGVQRIGVSVLSALNDINGSPVVHRGIVYAISHGGRLVAIDVRSGERVWERDVSGLNTPWIAGDYLFLVTTEGDALCLESSSGRVRWVQRLPRFEDPEEREGPITWSGPILLSDRLVIVGSNGDALAISPYSGRFLGRMTMPGGVRLPPIVANGTMYILTDEAQLAAFR